MGKGNTDEENNFQACCRKLRQRIIRTARAVVLLEVTSWGKKTGKRKGVPEKYDLRQCKDRSAQDEQKKFHSEGEKRK